MPLPEQTYFSITELAERWDIKEHRTLELILNSEVFAVAMVQAPARCAGVVDGEPCEMEGGFSFEFRTWFDQELLLSIYRTGEGAATWYIEDGLEYVFEPAAVIRTEDLRVTAEELARFEREHNIKAASTSNHHDADQLDDLPADFRALYESMGAGELPDIDLLIAAWRKFWKDRTPTDGKQDAIKPDVAAWIMNRMEGDDPSKSKAMAMASIIRPRWASNGGRPSRRN